VISRFFVGRAVAAPTLPGSSRDLVLEDVLDESMAVDAVWLELVAAVNSLVSGNFQEN